MGVEHLQFFIAQNPSLRTNQTFPRGDGNRAVVLVDTLSIIMAVCAYQQHLQESRKDKPYIHPHTNLLGGEAAIMKEACHNVLRTLRGPLKMNLLIMYDSSHSTAEVPQTATVIGKTITYGERTNKRQQEFMQHFACARMGVFWDSLSSDVKPYHHAGILHVVIDEINAEAVANGESEDTLIKSEECPYGEVDVHIGRLVAEKGIELILSTDTDMIVTNHGANVALTRDFPWPTLTCGNPISSLDIQTCSHQILCRAMGLKIEEALSFSNFESTTIVELFLVNDSVLLYVAAALCGNDITRSAFRGSLYHKIFFVSDGVPPHELIRRYKELTGVHTSVFPFEDHCNRLSYIREQIFSNDDNPDQPLEDNPHFRLLLDLLKNESIYESTMLYLYSSASDPDVSTSDEDYSESESQSSNIYSDEADSSEESSHDSGSEPSTEVPKIPLLDFYAAAGEEKYTFDSLFSLKLIHNRAGLLFRLLSSEGESSLDVRNKFLQLPDVVRKKMLIMTFNATELSEKTISQASLNHDMIQEHDVPTVEELMLFMICPALYEDELPVIAAMLTLVRHPDKELEKIKQELCSPGNILQPRILVLSRLVFDASKAVHSLLIIWGLKAGLDNPPFMSINAFVCAYSGSLLHGLYERKAQISDRFASDAFYSTLTSNVRRRLSEFVSHYSKIDHRKFGFRIDELSFTSKRLDNIEGDGESIVAKGTRHKNVLIESLPEEITLSEVAELCSKKGVVTGIFQLEISSQGQNVVVSMLLSEAATSLCTWIAGKSNFIIRGECYAAWFCDANGVTSHKKRQQMLGNRDDWQQKQPQFTEHKSHNATSDILDRGSWQQAQLASQKPSCSLSQSLLQRGENLSQFRTTNTTQPKGGRDNHLNGTQNPWIPGWRKKLNTL